MNQIVIYQVCVVTAILSNLIALMFFFKSKRIISGNKLCFYIWTSDQSIHTDRRLRKFMTACGIQYTFSLIGGNFMRYIALAFVNLFISNPLQDVLKQQIKKIVAIEHLESEIKERTDQSKHEYIVKYDNFVVLNYPSIFTKYYCVCDIQCVHKSNTTCMAYASSIMICTAIVGVLSNFYTIMCIRTRIFCCKFKSSTHYVYYYCLVLYKLTAIS